MIANTAPARERKTRRGRFGLSWKVKSHCFQVFHRLPKGHLLHEFAQRRVLKSLPRKPIFPTQQAGEDYYRHALILQERLGDLGTKRFFEFGGGWDLYSNLMLYCYGVNDQQVVDITPLASLADINHIISALQKDPPPQSVRVPTQLIQHDLRRELQKHYGITYSAPLDAQATSFAAGSIDAMVSTNTMEHIPEEILRGILKECRRLAHKDTIFSIQVDYSDHFAHTDKSINVYHYMRFSPKAWAYHNTPLHYQNRLRHSDYKRLFVEAGFEIVEEVAHIPKKAEEMLSAITLDAHFAAYTVEQLLPIMGRFVLVPLS